MLLIICSVSGLCLLSFECCCLLRGLMLTLFSFLLDDIDLVHGMPICVQIVRGRFGEERAVAVGKVVDELMNPTPFHP